MGQAAGDVPDDLLSAELMVEMAEAQDEAYLAYLDERGQAERVAAEASAMVARIEREAAGLPVPVLDFLENFSGASYIEFRERLGLPEGEQAEAGYRRFMDAVVWLDGLEPGQLAVLFESWQ
jgi:hypothetical protein